MTLHRCPNFSPLPLLCLSGLTDGRLTFVASPPTSSASSASPNRQRQQAAARRHLLPPPVHGHHRPRLLDSSRPTSRHRD
ncbi:unnamed protein product [Victoria cruziana]